MNESAAASTPFARRATALRRVLFGLYASALALGTHWPRLQIGDPAHPPDKLLHFVAFAGLAVMLWEARLVRRHRTLFLIGLIWVILDESTQALPGLGRTSSVEDVVAGGLGFFSASILLWSLRPRGGVASRLRRRRFERLLDALLARPANWMILGTAAALGATIGVPVAILLVHLFGLDEPPFQTALVGGMLGVAALGGAAARHGLRAMESTVVEQGRCLGCGAEDRSSEVACPRCGCEPLPGARLPWPSVGWPDVARASLLPLAGAGAMLLFLFTVWLGLVAARREVLLAARIDDLIRGLAPGMSTVLDASVIALVGAIAIDRARARLARRIDAGDRRCLGCGQDLRGTTVADGLGRCGECGGAFLRQAAGTLRTASAGHRMPSS